MGVIFFDIKEIVSFLKQHIILSDEKTLFNSTVNFTL